MSEVLAESWVKSSSPDGTLLPLDCAKADEDRLRSVKTVFAEVELGLSIVSVKVLLLVRGLNVSSLLLEVVEM